VARREFLRDLMETVAEHQTSVVLSSHLITDIERVSDYLIVVTASRVRLAGETEALLASHHRLSGPRRDPRTLPASWDVIEESHAGKPSTLLVRTSDPVLDPAWTVRPVTLEDMVLAYMSQPGDAPRAGRPGLEIAS
jgi:ABC-2 type transport system ATP-binding protein